MITETPHDQYTTVQQDATESSATLALEGMTCASCAMRIEKGLKKVPRVKDASVNFATEQATVTYDSAQTGMEQMVQKVDAVGYKAIPLVMPAPKLTPVEPEAESHVTLDLEGMTCASCAMRIEKGLKKVLGVKDASVNLATEQATVTYDPTQTNLEQMIQKVDAVGYKAIPLVLPASKPVIPVKDEPDNESRAVLDLEGMTCASCAMRIEKGLKKVPGVKDANVNLATEQAVVTYDPAQTNLEQMVQKVETVGYKATPPVATLQQPVAAKAVSAVSETPGSPVINIPQEDELSRR